MNTEPEYTLDELVDLTGFSKRQIRYYITRRLVPGAGDQRGPNTVYSRETLERLLAIGALKSEPVGPTGRTLTLAEIRHALDERPRRLQAGPAPGEFAQLMSTAAEYLKTTTRGPESPGVLMACSPRFASYVCEGESAYGTTHSTDARRDLDPAPTTILTDLLRSLQTLLTELGSDTRFDDHVSGGPAWRRLETPAVEIHVRTPDNMEARLRLNRMAAELGRLLAREE